MFDGTKQATERYAVLKKFIPENELERAIVKMATGAISNVEMMEVFFASYVYIIGSDEMISRGNSEVHEDWQNFFPLRFEVEGHPMAAVFSSLSKAQSYNHKPEKVLKILGWEHILRLPPDNGIVLNAGFEVQMKVPPSTIAEMKGHLKEKVTDQEMLADFKPENKLEEVILAAKKGEASAEEMFSTLAESNIYVASKTEIQTDWSGFLPFLVIENGAPYIAVFSSLERPDPQKHQANHVLQISAREFIRRILPEYGIVMNPGYVVHFLMPPSGVAEYRERLTKR